MTIPAGAGRAIVNHFERPLVVPDDDELVGTPHLDAEEGAHMLPGEDAGHSVPDEQGICPAGQLVRGVDLGEAVELRGPLAGCGPGIAAHCVVEIHAVDVGPECRANRIRNGEGVHHGGEWKPIHLGGRDRRDD